MILKIKKFLKSMPPSPPPRISRIWRSFCPPKFHHSGNVTANAPTEFLRLGNDGYKKDPIWLLIPLVINLFRSFWTKHTWGDVCGFRTIYTSYCTSPWRYRSELLDGQNCWSAAHNQHWTHLILSRRRINYLQLLCGYLLFSFN